MHNPPSGGKGYLSLVGQAGQSEQIEVHAGDLVQLHLVPNEPYTAADVTLGGVHLEGSLTATGDPYVFEVGTGDGVVQFFMVYPSPEPDAQLVFYRTSEVYHLQVLLEGQESITAVTVRMVDRGNGETIWEHALTAEEIASGAFEMKDYDLYAGEYIESRWDQVMQGYEPDPILQVTYTAVGADGAEETVTREAEAAYELWVSSRYDLKDPADDFLSYFMEQTTYPDSFVIRIEDTPYGELNISYGEDAALQPGDVAVTITVNGQTLSGEGARLVRTETVYDEGSLYAYAFVVPRPASLPEQGTAQITITRRLISYPDATRTDQKTVEYGQ